MPKCDDNRHWWSFQHDPLLLHAFPSFSASFLVVPHHRLPGSPMHSRTPARKQSSSDHLVLLPSCSGLGVSVLTMAKAHEKIQEGCATHDQICTSTLDTPGSVAQILQTTRTHPPVGGTRISPSPYSTEVHVLRRSLHAHAFAGSVFTDRARVGLLAQLHMGIFFRSSVLQARPETQSECETPPFRSLPPKVQDSWVFPMRHRGVI